MKEDRRWWILPRWLREILRELLDGARVCFISDIEIYINVMDVIVGNIKILLSLRLF